MNKHKKCYVGIVGLETNYKASRGRLLQVLSRWSTGKKKHYQSLANNNLRELVFGCYFIVLIFIEILMYYISFRRS